MHLITDKARRAIDQMNAAPEAILEIDSMCVSDGNSIRDDGA
jgi:hypothetical protein